MPQYELNLRDYWRIFRKRRAIIILTTILLGIFSFVFANLNRPMPLYQASASVKIERTPSVTGLYGSFYPFSPSNDIETQAMIITSYPILEKVAKRLNFVDKDLSSEEIKNSSELLGIVLGLKDLVATVQEGDTNIINIQVTTGSPTYSRNLANTVAEVFREEDFQQKNKQIVETRRFIEDQLKQVEARLKEAEEKVRSFRESEEIISLDSQTRIILDRLVATEADYKDLQADMEETETLLNQLKQMEASGITKVEAFKGESPSPTFTKLNEQLANLLIQRDTLLLTYTHEHPEVKETETRIRETMARMVNEVESRRISLQNQLRAKKEQMDNFKNQYKNLPTSGLMLARLEREEEVNRQVYAQLQEKYQEARIREAERVEEVTIIKPAVLPMGPINPPKVPLFTVLGVFLGLLLGSVFALVYESFDTSIGTIEDVETLLEIPVLGIVPFIGMSDIESASNLDLEFVRGFQDPVPLVSFLAPQSILSESFRSIRTNIQFLSMDKNYKTISVTSSTMGEGKSSVAVNLALTFAQMGNKTLLVDADFRRPEIHKLFGLEIEPGFTDVILGNYDLDEATNNITDLMMGSLGMDGIVKCPGIDNLHVLTSGNFPPNPSELLLADKTTEIIARVREGYDVVILDTPPVLPATDAAILGTKVDGMVLVYRAGEVARGALRRVKTQLDAVKANVLGVVLNQLTPEASADFDDLEQYKKYQYRYAEEEEEKVYGIAGRIKRLFKRGKRKGTATEGYQDNYSLKILVAIIAVLSLLGLLIFL